MSKSLGNSPDPLDLIDKYGADAIKIQFPLQYITGTGHTFFRKTS